MLSFPYEDVALGAFVSHDGLQFYDGWMFEGQKNLDFSADLALSDYFSYLFTWFEDLKHGHAGFLGFFVCTDGLVDVAVLTSADFVDDLIRIHMGVAA